MVRLHRPLVLVLLFVLLLAGLAVLLDWWMCVPPGTTADYVGRRSCLDCHAEEDALWVGSDHERAMAVAGEEMVLGEFDGRQIEHFGVRSRMFRHGEKFLVHTDDRQGKMRDFEVKYTFGVRPLQQYLVEFPDGRVQCLRLAWDTEERRWFHLYAGEPIPHTDSGARRATGARPHRLGASVPWSASRHTAGGPPVTPRLSGRRR